MLNLYQSFKVPEVDHVQIYRDDANPHKFYMVSERATIARDDEGQPLFSFILYARDADRLAPDDLEVERAYLAITTQAAVTKETEDKIREYLRQKLNDELNRRWWYLGNPITRPEPELGYPDLWLDGTVEFRAVGPDMVPYSAGSNEPSLVGANVASFSAMLSQDGAELFRQAAEKGKVPAGIWYKLSFAARIPAITIHIRGDRSEFYHEVKNYIKHRWEHVSRRSFLGWTYAEYRHVHEWEELASITKFRNSFHGLTITVDDSSLPDSEKNEMKDELETMAFDIFQSNIMPTFFEPALQEVAKEEQDLAASIPVNTEITGTIDMTITRTEIVKKKVNPNAQLAQALTPEEVKTQTIYADLSQTFFQELDVFVNANVNFEADPVFALKVFLDYDQQDEVRNVRIKKAKEFLFKNGNQVGRFRQIMAKASDGSPKDSYRYWSEISYKDTGETIRIPRTGSIEARERQLVISYRRLGFVKVNILLGTMPSNIRSVQLNMRYPGYSGPSGQQSFELTTAKPTATFFTYTGQASEPGPYRYQISYVLADGQRMDMPEQTGQADSLTIQDPFEQTVTTRFLAQADFTVVQKIIVDARYRDPGNDFSADHHAELMNNGESSAWSFGLRNPDQREIEFNVIIVYKNGSREEQPAQKRTVGETIPVGAGAVDALEVTVIASLVDWSKYRLVLVYLEYSDPANNIREEKNFVFRPENSDDQLWKVLLRDKQQQSFRYRVRYIGANSSDNQEIDWVLTQDPLLVLQ